MPLTDEVLRIYPESEIYASKFIYKKILFTKMLSIILDNAREEIKNIENEMNSTNKSQQKEKMYTI